VNIIVQTITIALLASDILFIRILNHNLLLLWNSKLVMIQSRSA